jgi:hypothetical protein
MQVRERSNKFTCCRSQYSLVFDGERLCIQVEEGPQLAMVQLSKVCKKTYDEVALTYIFYSGNQFKFLDRNAAVTYIVALTPNRRSAIRSIVVPWETCYAGSIQYKDHLTWGVG